ncbi:MAG: GreA/GreB family elongation factor [Pseudomonadota bacterium]
MNKSLLLKDILHELESLHQVAVEAAMQAYNTATHDENIAENKYDTLGLEAAYLAQGQSQRVAECASDMAKYKKLSAITFTSETAIGIGAVVDLVDESGRTQSLFIGPAAGGLKLTSQQVELTIVTPSAPLGAALVGHYVDDEIKVLVGGGEKHYEVVAVC